MTITAQELAVGTAQSNQTERPIKQQTIKSSPLHPSTRDSRIAFNNNQSWASVVSSSPLKAPDKKQTAPEQNTRLETEVDCNKITEEQASLHMETSSPKFPARHTEAGDEPMDIPQDYTGTGPADFINRISPVRAAFEKCQAAITATQGRETGFISSTGTQQTHLPSQQQADSAATGAGETSDDNQMDYALSSDIEARCELGDRRTTNSKTRDNKRDVLLMQCRQTQPDDPTSLDSHAQQSNREEPCDSMDMGTV